MEEKLNLQVDTFNMESAISSSSINENDLAAGRFDGAKISVYYVNYINVNERVLISVGFMGNIQRNLSVFTAEFRSLPNALDQRIGDTFQRTCPVTLGSQRCGVDLSQTKYFRSANIVSQVGQKSFTVSINPPASAEVFKHGIVEFLSGDNNGLTFEIKYDLLRNSVRTLFLWDPLPFLLQPNNRAKLIYGCNKSTDHCRNKFNNIINYQGFNYVPGVDYVTKYTKSGDSGNTGGSIFDRSP